MPANILFYKSEILEGWGFGVFFASFNVTKIQLFSSLEKNSFGVVHKKIWKIM